MLELLITALQWSLIVGIWAFTAIGFYRSFQEIKRVYRRADMRPFVSNVGRIPAQTASREWLVAA